MAPLSVEDLNIVLQSDDGLIKERLDKDIQQRGTPPSSTRTARSGLKCDYSVTLKNVDTWEDVFASSVPNAKDHLAVLRLHLESIIPFTNGKAAWVSTPYTAINTITQLMLEIEERIRKSPINAATIAPALDVDGLLNNIIIRNRESSGVFSTAETKGIREVEYRPGDVLAMRGVDPGTIYLARCKYLLTEDVPPAQLIVEGSKHPAITNDFDHHNFVYCIWFVINNTRKGDSETKWEEFPFTEMFDESKYGTVQPRPAVLYSAFELNKTNKKIPVHVARNIRNAYNALTHL